MAIAGKESEYEIAPPSPPASARLESAAPESPELPELEPEPLLELDPELEPLSLPLPPPLPPLELAEPSPVIDPSGGPLEPPFERLPQAPVNAVASIAAAITRALIALRILPARLRMHHDALPSTFSSCGGVGITPPLP
jgi:hypothetical protein